MKNKKFSFSILEEIEKNKIEKEMINIQNLFFKEKQNNEQLKLLINYQKEYEKKIHDKITLGVYIYQWKNYNNFISILESVIKDHINIIEENKKIIKESLGKWSRYQIKLKIWKYLNTINKKKILKINKIQEQIYNDSYAQLKILKKGR